MYRLAFTLGPCAAVALVLKKTIGGFSNAATLNGSEVVESALSEPELQKPMMEMTPMIVRSHPRFGSPDLIGDVIGVTDFLTKAVWHCNELYQAARPEMRVEEDLGVRIPLRKGRAFCACILRDSRTFRRKDRLLFSFLRPHIRNLLDPPPLEHGPSRLGTLGLTPREREVLFWISEGKRNSEVAEVMGVSQGTVKRHLENLYQKLGVENRHAAVRRALEILHHIG